MKPTPTENRLALRPADFSTLTEALDYAAQGETGLNFYTGADKLCAVLPYAELREQARALARRLHGFRLERGARVAIIADTHPDFHRFYFASQYAGLVPTPLPASLHLGSHQAYVAQLRRLLVNSQASIAMAPTGILPFLVKAAEGLDLRFLGSPEDFAGLPQGGSELRPLESDEVAYFQYTSGSTRFPRGVMITQRAVMMNLADISNHGAKIRPGDRCVSWLPYYHDMGLVGLVLVPLANQLSADYLGTRDFAMRPRQWLALMTRNRGTISFSPPFGYELCARCVRDKEAAQFDLSAWRIAGVGAEMIHPSTLARFAEALEPGGFDSRAFVACYGMAECSLAVSFAPLNRGLEVDCVDADHLGEYHEAVPAGSVPGKAAVRVTCLVNCGTPLPGYELEVRDREGRALPERQGGTLFVRGPSLMSGYFGDAKATEEALSPDGWLNTGDLGYRIRDTIVITGREKDMMIINGRNIWPQDLEYLAEQQPEVRTGDASAFSVSGPDGEEKAVMVIQCRVSHAAKRASLAERLQGLVREEIGITCFVELVPPRTLPRTSSGKLSRSGARKDFLKRVASGRTSSPGEVVCAPSIGEQGVHPELL